MTTTRRAARSLGGIVMAPPIDAAEAGGILGTEPSPEAWSAVRHAFARYGFALDNLATSKASRKNDGESWHVRQTQTAKALEVAFQKVQAARSNHGRFIDEAGDNYSLQTFGHSAGLEKTPRRLLDDATRSLMHAIAIIERAKPMEWDVPTAVTARDDLVRAIAAALEADGIAVETSTGWHLDALDRPARLSDLTAFEQLIDALGIGDEKNAAAFAAWLRGATGGKRG